MAKKKAAAENSDVGSNDTQQATDGQQSLTKTKESTLKGSTVSFVNEAGKHSAQVLEVYNDDSVKLQVGTVESGYFIEDNVKLSSDGAIGTYSI